jgi:predicted Na+-dependent transporter
MGANILQPHLLLPVEAGERCRVAWLCWLLLHADKMSNSKSDILKSKFRIPGLEVIFFNLFIYAILTLCYCNFPIEI